MKSKSAPINVLRWYNFLNAQEAVKNTLNSLPSDVRANLNQQDKGSVKNEKAAVGNRAQEGKFVDLPFAEMGKVIVRFPPEASGWDIKNYAITIVVCATRVGMMAISHKDVRVRHG